MHHKCIYFPPKTKANHNFTPPIFITADKPPMHGCFSAALCWSGGALVLASNGGKLPAWVGCSWVLYSTNWANYATLPRATTQNTPQHTTTHMSRHHPTHQRLWSSLSMAASAMGLDLGAATPYGSEAGTGHLVHSRHCRFH